MANTPKTRFALVLIEHDAETEADQTIGDGATAHHVWALTGDEDIPTQRDIMARVWWMLGITLGVPNLD